MGLTRKKVTVRTKKGKTFQRSVMVRAEAIGKRAGGKKLNSLNPWEAHHTELVKGPFPKSSGSSGPGSDHSWLALAIGGMRQNRPPTTRHDTHEPFTEEHARIRRERNEWVAGGLAGSSGSGIARIEVAHAHGVPTHWMDEPRHRSSEREHSLAAAFRVDSRDVNAVPPRGGWNHSGWGHES